MNLTRCAKGHYYDMDKFSMCPHCASANEGMGQTMRYTQPVNDSAFSGGTSLSSNATDDTVNYTDADTSFTDMINDAKNKPEKDDDDSVTIGFGDKGTGFPLKTGRNFIGRNANQDIVLAKDRTVSRDKHAIIVYEPRQRKFIVQPGDSRGLFYLNDEVVLGSKELNAYDVILVGETKLAFIPFCGKKFSWDDGLQSEEE